MASVAQKIGCTPETLRQWVRSQERDEGRRPGPTTDDRTRLKELERENRMVRFIDEHRALYGVEPICAVLPIAPSTYYAHKARQADPARRSVRAQRDERL
jgi:hypothetical protein